MIGRSTSTAKLARVRHFVYSSVAGADQNTGIPHFETKHVVEQHLHQSGLPYTIVAPVFFMENFLGPSFSQRLPQKLSGYISRLRTVYC